MAVKVSTRRYERTHGKPAGVGTWTFENTTDQTMPTSQCRFFNGTLHDEHMAMDDQCPHCGARRTTVTRKTYTAAAATLRAGTYTLCT
jgi:hypothetical protein